jgi:hypothetical protein
VCLLQFLFKLMIVFNEPIVNKCNSFPLIVVGVRIDVGLVAVGGPPRVPQPDVVLVAGPPLQLHPLDAVAPESITRCELSAHELSTLRVYSHYPT